MDKQLPPILSLRTKISYGVGDLGLALTGAMLGLLFAKFLTDTVGLPPSMVAVAIFVGRTWDWVNDPIQGYISDHIRTRWGRRRPFLLFGSIPFGLTFLSLWWIPPIHSQIWLTAYYTAAYFLFDTVVTIIFIPYIALTPEISDDYDGRTSLTGFRMFFSLSGSLLGTVVPLLILGGAALPPGKSSLVFIIGAFMAVISSIPFLITFAGTKENLEHIQHEQPSLRETFMAMMANRPYLMAIAIYLTTSTALEVIIGISLYFIQYRLQMPAIAGYISLTMFVVALAAIPFWSWVSNRLDKVKSYAVAIAYLIIVLGIYASFDSRVPVYLPFIFSAMAGFGISAAQTLPWAILPDTIEYGEYQTGKRNEGVFYSLMTLARKIASSATLPTVLLLFARSGYVPNALQQAPATQTMIAFLFAGIPAIFFLIGLVIALRYPLNRQRFNEIKSELERRKTTPPEK
jgi:GPH family glycoside/pentoside/hexuronide:cation symporter